MPAAINNMKFMKFGSVLTVITQYFSKIIYMLYNTLYK